MTWTAGSEVAFSVTELGDLSGADAKEVMERFKRFFFLGGGQKVKKKTPKYWCTPQFYVFF